MLKKLSKKFIDEQREKLLKGRKKLEERLSFFAKKSDKVKGDWLTVYPTFDGGGLEEEADEVEEYGNLLSVAYNLELELKK